MHAVVLMQVCRRLSSEETESSGTERTSTAGDGGSRPVPALAASGSSRARRRQSNSRSSYSGTSTESDRPSSNGGGGACDDDTPVFDSDDAAAGLPASALPAVIRSRGGAAGGGMISNQRPSCTESVPPVPPPRRYVVPLPDSDDDVWQRHTSRPATDSVQRRVLSPAATASAKSCPCSPLLDSAGAGMRRTTALTTQDAGLGDVNSSVQLTTAALQNDDRAPAAGKIPSSSSTSTAVNRRTRLPLSGLVRTPRDLR